MATIKGYGINDKTNIVIRNFSKGKKQNGEEWMCINYNDSVKNNNGSYDILGKYVIWVDNNDIIKYLNKNTTIRVDNIKRIFFAKNSYQSNGNNVTEIVLNVIADVSIVGNNTTPNPTPTQEIQNTPRQSYTGSTLPPTDDYGLPNWE